MAQLWFLSNALLYYVFHHFLKFQVDSLYGLDVMIWTRIQTNKTKGNNLNKVGRVIVLTHCTSLKYVGSVPEKKYMILLFIHT